MGYMKLDIFTFLREGSDVFWDGGDSIECFERPSRLFVPVVRQRVGKDLCEVFGQGGHRLLIVRTPFYAVLPEPRLGRDLNAEIEEEREQRRRGRRPTPGATSAATATTTTLAVGDELVTDVVVVDVS